jgi:Pectate lyase superfamily protein
LSGANVQNFGATGNGTSDDRPPIQRAIDYVANQGGGEVFFPKGIYIIGTEGASPTTNQPLYIDSNLRLIGEGIGKTTLQLCKEVNMLWPGQDVLWPGAPLGECSRWTAGPIFVNRHCPWWFDPNNPTPTLPWDRNIEIGYMSFDGDRNHQTKVYEPQYRTQLPNMHDLSERYGYGILPSMQWEGTNDNPDGMLPRNGGHARAGETVGMHVKYDVMIRFMDGDGNEGIFSQFGPYEIDPSDRGNNAIKILLPPLQYYPSGPVPQGAVYIVPYIRRADYAGTRDWNVDSPHNEVDRCGNARYERLNKIELGSLRWDGYPVVYPGVAHGPKIDITSHTYYLQGDVDTQGNCITFGLWNGGVLDDAPPALGHALYSLAQ